MGFCWKSETFLTNRIVSSDSLVWGCSVGRQGAYVASILMDNTSDKSTNGIFLLHFHFPQPRKCSTNAHTAAADSVVYREMTVDDKIPNAHFHIGSNAVRFVSFFQFISPFRVVLKQSPVRNESVTSNACIFGLEAKLCTSMDISQNNIETSYPVLSNAELESFVAEHYRAI